MEASPLARGAVSGVAATAASGGAAEDPVLRTTRTSGLNTFSVCGLPAAAAARTTEAGVAGTRSQERTGKIRFGVGGLNRCLEASGRAVRGRRGDWDRGASGDHW